MNNKGSALLISIMVSAVIAAILMKAYDSYIIVSSNTLTNQRKKTDEKIAELLAMKQEVQDLLDELESETSDIPRICEPGETACLEKCGTPLTCRHNHANGKTVQACEGDCVLTAGVWYKGGQACDIGMECQK